MTDDAPGRLSPYRGLEPFDERDADFFFGRERESRLITANLYAAALTLLYGASGVGKSSVLRAGVLPLLRQRRDVLPIVFPTVAPEGRVPGSAVSIRGWQSDPLGGIKETTAIALYASAGEDQKARNRFQDTVLSHEMAPLKEFLTACAEVSGRRLMVILDQFEEYSLYHAEDDAFAAQFPAAIVPGDLSTSFLVSLREDALAKLDRFKGRIPTLWDSYRRIDHLDRAAAENAIRLPLDEYNRRRKASSPPVGIEDALVKAVLRDVRTDSVQFEGTGSGTAEMPPGSEGRIEAPYLQLVMMRLWEREQAEESTTLRLETLQAEGGAPEIVRTHLDRVMEQFTPEERDIAARIFHRLVTPSGAKIAFNVSDLAEYEVIEPELLTPILGRLEEGSRRILRRVASPSDDPDEPRYEIFHDRLGAAILAWRAKRLKEQERERTQREEAEQKRLAEQTRASHRKHLDTAIHDLGVEGEAVWARMMLYLVSTSGIRFTQTVPDLARLSQQPLETVEAVVQRLAAAGVLRRAYAKAGSDENALYEIVHDAMAASMLDWHSQYAIAQARTAKERVLESPALPDSTAAPEFPYRMVRARLYEGRIVPFLGAGVPLSARPRDASSPGGNKAYLPSHREIKELLARECDFPPSELEASDIAEVASFFAYKLGRESLDALLHETLGRTDSTPSATHRFLAEVGKSIAGLRRKPSAAHERLLIMTTNYDTLMEQALAEAGVRHDVVAYVQHHPAAKGKFGVLRYRAKEPEFVEASDLDFLSQVCVYRLNGPLILRGQRVGSYAITEEDQIDWLMGIESKRSALPPFVLSKLHRTHLLSLGHSARDWSQRALLRTLVDRKLSGKFMSWAVALNPAPLSVMTWQRYKVEVFNLHLNEWAARMHEADMRSALKS